MYQESEFG